MDKIQLILGLVQKVSGFIPMGTIAVTLAKATLEQIQLKADQEGKTIAQLHEHAGVKFDEAEFKLLEDIAAGE